MGRIERVDGLQDGDGLMDCRRWRAVGQVAEELRQSHLVRHQEARVETDVHQGIPRYLRYGEFLKAFEPGARVEMANDTAVAHMQHALQGRRLLAISKEGNRNNTVN